MNNSNAEKPGNFKSVKDANKYVDKTTKDSHGRLDKGTYALDSEVENIANKIINKHLDAFDKLK